MPPRRNRDRRATPKAVPAERRQKQRRLDEERRSSIRIPIDLWMEEVHGDEIYFRRSCNISEGGVFFDQSIPHPVGTLITLRFQLPGSPQEITTHGEVVSAARSVDGLGMGVKFTEIAASQRAVLRTYIHDAQSKRGTV